MQMKHRWVFSYSYLRMISAQLSNNILGIILCMERKNGKKIFMLIDGSAIIHRAYHAMPNFTLEDGTPIGAVYGFYSMLLKLMLHVSPEYIAVSFDRGKPVFRTELLPAYHANRPSSTPEFKNQYNMVRETLKEITIPTYEMEGFEADDIIGTIATEVSKKNGVVVYVVTGDRDMMQLVRENVKVLMPVKGISEVMIYDEARVKEKFGVRPDQIVDLKAFMGDPSDNYPGVPGIGPKTAMQLLEQYEHFEGVFSHLSEIQAKNPRLGSKLAEYTKQAEISKQLATILTNVPIKFKFDECDTKNFTQEKFHNVLKQVSFKSLLGRLDELFGNTGTTRAQMKLL